MGCDWWEGVVSGKGVVIGNGVVSWRYMVSGMGVFSRKGVVSGGGVFSGEGSDIEIDIEMYSMKYLV